jgi:hypothetical protein
LKLLHEEVLSGMEMIEAIYERTAALFDSNHFDLSSPSRNTMEGFVEVASEEEGSNIEC